MNNENEVDLTSVLLTIRVLDKISILSFDEGELLTYFSVVKVDDESLIFWAVFVLFECIGQ